MRFVCVVAVVAAIGCGDGRSIPDGCTDPSIGQSCDVGVGACKRTGTWICGSDGSPTCDGQPGQPSEEQCNGVDDNCDGQVDEGFGLGQDCSAGVGACAAAGHMVCNASGQPTCDAVAGAPGPETCNGIDDNCDGQVDEGFDLGTACTVGQGVCEASGVVVCDADTELAICDAMPGSPTAETCNGLDDDCNGIVDDVAGVGDACIADAAGICANGHKVCLDNELVCGRGSPQDESCNGLDDDCNGVVDDLPDVGTDCDTGAMGVCSAGVQACGTNGSLVCEQTTAASAEICNGLDDDCNGAVDDGCMPAVPRPRTPWNGMLTGSLWTPELPGGATPLRPHFMWPAVQGAAHYEIQIDDSCSPTAFRSCAFASPEVNASITTTTFQPAQPLAVATTAPVGRRYYWRVRACGANGCSPYAEVRYLDVGRVAGDVNGDGYPDLLVGGRNDPGGEGGVFEYLSGSSGLPSTPALKLVSPQSTEFFDNAHIVGDLNGDGFADAVIEDTEHALRVYLGSTSGLPATPSLSIQSPQPSNGFSEATFGAGDVDGDGAADLVVGDASQKRAYFYRGSLGTISTTPLLTFHDPLGSSSFSPFTAFGASGGALGDIDGDGYPDFAIGAISEPTDGNDMAGAAFIYRGGPSVSNKPTQELFNVVAPSKSGFGYLFRGAVDLDHDGFSDVLIAPLAESLTAPGDIYIYRGSETGLVEPPFHVINDSATFGQDAAFGDINGDGVIDLLVTDEHAYSGASPDGVAYVYANNGSFGSRVTIPPVVTNNSQRFGHVALLCDFNSDGFDERVIDAPGIDTPVGDEGAVYIYAGGPTVTTTPSTTLSPPGNPPSDFYGEHMSCGR